MPKEVTIIVNDKSNTNAELIELAGILKSLRHYSKEWKNNYGYHARRQKEYWETKADEWLYQNVEEKE